MRCLPHKGLNVAPWSSANIQLTFLPRAHHYSQHVHCTKQSRFSQPLRKRAASAATTLQRKSRSCAVYPIVIPVIHWRAVQWVIISNIIDNSGLFNTSMSNNDVFNTFMSNNRYVKKYVLRIKFFFFSVRVRNLNLFAKPISLEHFRHIPNTADVKHVICLVVVSCNSS